MELMALFGVYRIEKYKWPVQVMSVNVVVTGIISYFAACQEYGVISFLAILTVLAGMSSAAIIDLKEKRIPNYIILVMALLQVLLTVAKLVIYTENWREILISSVLNPVIVFIVLLLLARLSKDGIGMGDVKLLTVMAFICGAYHVLNTMVFALLSCVLVAMILIFIKKKKTKDKIAFAPFIYIGFCVTLLLGV